MRGACLARAVWHARRASCMWRLGGKGHRGATALLMSAGCQNRVPFGGLGHLTPMPRGQRSVKLPYRQWPMGTLHRGGGCRLLKA